MAAPSKQFRLENRAVEKRNGNRENYIMDGVIKK
jgi:hypothetical protein